MLRVMESLCHHYLLNITENLLFLVAPCPRDLQKGGGHDYLECWPITTHAELGSSTRVLAPDGLCLSARVLAELWQSILMVAHSCLGWPLYRSSNEGAGPGLPSTRVLAPDCLCRALGQRFWPLTAFYKGAGPWLSLSTIQELHKGAGP